MKTHEKRGGGKGSGSGRMTPRMRRWKGRRIKRDRKYPPPIPVFGHCRRCGARFAPEWIDALGRFGTCCSRCQVKNLAFGLGIPELLVMAGIPIDEK